MPSPKFLAGCVTVNDSLFISVDARLDLNKVCLAILHRIQKYIAGKKYQPSLISHIQSLLSTNTFFDWISDFGFNISKLCKYANNDTGGYINLEKKSKTSKHLNKNPTLN